MGDFLTTPIKDKESYDNESAYVKIKNKTKINMRIQVRFGASGMQGWRKRMEDAHIHSVNIGANKNVDVFGVFDGHGGKEVAQYVRIHFVEALENNENFKKGDYKAALKENFLRMDEMMRTDDGKAELTQLAKKSKDKPTVIIAKTQIGYGSVNANSNKAHGTPLTPDQVVELKKTLNFNLNYNLTKYFNLKY